MFSPFTTSHRGFLGRIFPDAVALDGTNYEEDTTYSIEECMKYITIVWNLISQTECDQKNADND